MYTVLVRLVTDGLLLTSFGGQSAYLRRSVFVGSVPVTVRTVFLLPSQPGRRNCLCFLGTTPGQQAAPLGPPAATRYSLPPLPVKLRGFSRFGRPGFGLWVCNCAILWVWRVLWRCVFPKSSHRRPIAIAAPSRAFPVYTFPGGRTLEVLV